MHRLVVGSALALALASSVAACSGAARGPATSAAPTAAAAPAPRLSRAERFKADTEGIAAYERKDWAACAALLERGEDWYNAACCHAQGGAADRAFAVLPKAFEHDVDGLDHMRKDSDLAPLHADPRWPRLIAELEARLATYHASINRELQQLFDEDQADRKLPADKIDWAVVGPRDDARGKRVDEIIAAGGAKVSADYYHAAMVHQHGQGVEAIARAHELAKKAVELDPKNKRARWLTAASEDRLLVRQGKQQKWGTQYTKRDGKWVLEPVDPAITDEQRAAWNVPTLAEAQEIANQMNAGVQTFQ